MYENQEIQKERKPIAFLSSLRKHFAFWKILSLHFVDGANEIIPGCISHRQLPRSLCYKDRHFSETWKPSRPLVEETAQAMFLWALLYPAAAQYTDSMWTAPVWAGHCTQQDLQVEDFPLTLTPTHTFAQHILILPPKSIEFPLNHGHTLVPHASLLLENLFSWSTSIWRNVWA